MLQKRIQINKSYPLAITLFENGLFEINDKSKREYLKYTDDERESFILEAKKLALLDNEKVNSKIIEAIEKIKKLTSDEVEIAYLDNQLFDFANKGKTK